MRKKIEKIVRELEEKILCISGDFNSRIGKERKKYEEEDKEKLKRQDSK